MVTSDEERQGVSGQDHNPVAAPLDAPVPEAQSGQDSQGPHETPVEAETDPTDADKAHLPDTLEHDQTAWPEATVEELSAPTPPPVEAQSVELSVVDAPFEWLVAKPASAAELVARQAEAGPRMSAADLAGDAGLSEDEATGKRVESLLVEAPDADPQTPHPARGEPNKRSEPRGDPAGDVIAPLTFDVDDIPPMPHTTAPFREGLRRHGMNRVGPIVAFDFDGTLTVRDSFTAFLRWREGAARYHAEMASLAPAALKYLFDRDPGKLKTAAVRRFLQGLPRDVLNAEAMEFAAACAPTLFRPDALRAWRRYRLDGARLVIVTASPENIVAPFARGLGCDLLIGTQLLFDAEDRVQGGLLGDNCRGPEKVRRLRHALGEDVVLAAAYGDTDGDWDMLEMAEQQFMRLFVGTPGKLGGPG